MEDSELTPQGASPQPEPATPVEDLSPAPEHPQADHPQAEQAQVEHPQAPGVEDPSPVAAPLAETETPAEAPPSEVQPEAAAPDVPVSVDEFMASNEIGPAEPPAPVSQEDSQIKAILEAIVYVAEEPLTLAQIAASLQQPAERILKLLNELIAEFDQPGHGVSVREVAGGYKMATKPEHHEAVRNFVKSLKPPLKLSLPALETLAVIAYKQPATGPEIMEIRGVQGGGVLKTLLDRKLIAVSGRKNVIGKPMLYKTTKEFLIQFGLKDLSELPSLKEFEEIRRMAFSDSEVPSQEPVAVAPEATPETAAPAAEMAHVAESTPEIAAPAAEMAPEAPEATPETAAPAAEMAPEAPEAAPETAAPAAEMAPEQSEATNPAAPMAPVAESAPHEES
jgi:segregation and condensation protein B